jgi:hypothetical protein
MFIKDTVIQKINEYINQETDECIEYPVLSSDGYGEMQTRVDGKKIHYRMHRVAYQVYYNDDLTSKDIICHKCDNPKCVNPRHLFKGTHNDNVQDKCSKGRQAKGEENGRYIDGRSLIKEIKDQTKAHGRKLTKEQVLEVRKLREDGQKLEDISALTGISVSSVKDICSGRTYKCYL